MNTDELHSQYLDLGYQPIPLRPGEKLPLAKGWQVKPTVRQWYKAPGNVNIGLRAGEGRAFIDCDDKNHPGTFENVTRWLDGLGYHPGSYPVVQTASGVGRHIYVNFTDRMLGSKRNFVNQIGAGGFSIQLRRVCCGATFHGRYWNLYLDRWRSITPAHIKPERYSNACEYR